MKPDKFDVAVIGGGPAGTRAAALIAGRGYSVLVLEKRERIGYPVRCAEAVGPREDVERFLHLDGSLVSSPVDGFLIFSPHGEKYELEKPGIGFIVDRELFDRRLAEAAEAAGAEVKTCHQVVGLIKDGRRVTGVKIKDLRSGRGYDVASSVVVGADGVEALSPRWAGLKGSFGPGEILSCAQELIDGIDIPRAFIEFHLGRRFAPGGYAWVFPKGGGRANVGVGINPLMSGGLTALDYLNEFIGHRCPGGARRRLVIGGCAVARGLRTMATDGYLTVGEAAHQNNPFSGGGIINALEGADMAAETIVHALQKGDASAKALGTYSRSWKRSIGRANEVFYIAARIFYGLSDMEMNRIMSRTAHFNGIFNDKGVSPVKMILAILTCRPSLLFDIPSHLFRGRIKR